ncbi:MAG: BON domain-containing protein [Methylobacteriaceae bacterium]|nr:BON domain-containing protein [Methylobacteriaceae bacterium]
MDDKTLRQMVIDELDFEPSVDAAHIGVAVENGVVTLSGHVDTYAEKIAAEHAAQRVKGVGGIAEEIEVRRRGSHPLGDDEIAKRCLDVLAWDALLPKDAVQVKVERGFVQLRGKVKWQFQREAAEKRVRKLTGVIGVCNQVEVKTEVRAVYVKERIEAALRRNALVEANAIRVLVEEDQVTLEGKVQAWPERVAAAKAAWSAPGVNSVIDNLRVA